MKVVQTSILLWPNGTGLISSVALNEGSNVQGPLHVTIKYIITAYIATLKSDQETAFIFKMHVHICLYIQKCIC